MNRRQMMLVKEDMTNIRLRNSGFRTPEADKAMKDRRARLDKKKAEIDLKRALKELEDYL